MEIFLLVTVVLEGLAIWLMCAENNHKNCEILRLCDRNKKLVGKLDKLEMQLYREEFREEIKKRLNYKKGGSSED